MVSCDSSHWLAGSVRLLLKRVDTLEALLRADHQPPFRWNLRVPKFYPQAPPGVHHPAADHHFAKLIQKIVDENYEIDDDYGEQYNECVQILEQNEHDTKTHATDAETSEFSRHQFIAPDEARDPVNAANNDVTRTNTLFAEVLDDEDVLDFQTFHAHRSEFSEHATDDYANEFADKDDVPTLDMPVDAKSNILRDNVYDFAPDDVQYVPAADIFLQISHRKPECHDEIAFCLEAFATRHMPRNDDDDQYEYGDVDTPSIDTNASDFAHHQLVAPDVARFAEMPMSTFLRVAREVRARLPLYVLQMPV